MRELTPSTLRSHVVKRLREAILSGKYRPGDRLNESSIAREFEISRIPVREALFELRESGLVMSHERRGMFVTSLSEEDVEKLNSVRVVLETEALKLARVHMTSDTATALTDLVNRMETWKGPLSEAVALDLKFHRTIWAAAGNNYLVKVLDSLATVSFAHNTLEHVSHELRRWRLNHHRALLNVVLSSDEQDIRAALLLHLQMAYTHNGAVPQSDRTCAQTTLRPGPQRKTVSSKLPSSSRSRRKVDPGKQGRDSRFDSAVLQSNRG